MTDAHATPEQDASSPASKVLKFAEKILPKVLVEMLETVLTVTVLKTITEAGKKKIVVDPDFVRQHAPRLYKTARHSEQYALLMSKLDFVHQRILDSWLFSKSENQQAEFIVKILGTTLGVDALQSASHQGEMEPSLENSLAVLRYVAELRSDAERDRVADARNYYRDEDAYLIVKIEKFLGARFKNLEDFAEWLSKQSTKKLKAANQWMGRDLNRRNSGLNALWARLFA